MIWSQTYDGRAFNLLDPDPADICFREIATTLSQINRYAGASRAPVSVALHTLIAADNAPPSLKAHVLLHDAHEAYIGDITTPTAAALARLADDRNAPICVVRPGAAIVREALAKLKFGIDVAIYEAADLPPPDARMQAEIKHADRIALMTERRDFLAAPPRPWGLELEAVAPAKRVYRAGTFGRTPVDVAGALYDEFRRWLPAFGGGAEPQRRRRATSGAAAQPKEQA